MQHRRMPPPSGEPCNFEWATPAPLGYSHAYIGVTEAVSDKYWQKRERRILQWLQDASHCTKSQIPGIDSVFANTSPACFGQKSPGYRVEYSLRAGMDKTRILLLFPNKAEHTEDRLVKVYSNDPLCIHAIERVTEALARYL